MPDNNRERRQTVQISDEDMNLIAEKAATRALEKVYAEVGKTVATKIFLVLVVGGLMLMITFKSDKLLALLR